MFLCSLNSCIVLYCSVLGNPINLFESASIVQYFAEKYDKFIPKDPSKRQECFNWVYWQMGGFGPFCGQFGHFFVYAPGDKVETRDYGVARYGTYELHPLRP
jgi:GSH-dependent disulfide-bond oxidoreductase